MSVQLVDKLEGGEEGGDGAAGGGGGGGGGDGARERYARAIDGSHPEGRCVWVPVDADELIRERKRRSKRLSRGTGRGADDPACDDGGHEHDEHSHSHSHENDNFCHSTSGHKRGRSQY